METTSFYEAAADKRKVKQGQKAWKYIKELSSLTISDLNKTAVVDSTREYTYGLMFREWERYASVFTALGMTQEQHARVGILGSTSAEVVFSFYGLNMVGAQVSLVASYYAFNTTQIKETILQEKLTDFILTDEMAQQDLVRELVLKRRKLGLRHIILLHVPVGGPTVLPVMTAAQEAKYASMKAVFQPICMDMLLKAYENHPVSYAPDKPDDTAFIMHTSGSTSGTGKPIPLSDSALNAAVARFFKLKDLSLPDNLVTAMGVDLSNSYGIIDQVHLPFAMGATVTAIPGGLLNPWFYNAIPAYKISFLFCINAAFEHWMKLPADTLFDFSSLEFVALGGASVSAADKKRYHSFIVEHGGKDVKLLNGYGLSELGGACCLSTPDLNDESIGYPMPGVTIRLYDEDKERFFSPRRGKVSEGVLYMNSYSMATPVLDGKEVVKVETIDRQTYVCTNDLVRVDEKGRITYLGRANRFFMQEEGRKYDAGRVETELSRLENIENCAIVPVFVKMRHDNVPMLCVKTLDEAGEPLDVVLDALRQVFITDKLLPEEDVPFRVLIADMLPRNGNGKVDLYQINRGNVSGYKYSVDPVHVNGQLTDFILTVCDDGPADMIEQLVDDISTDIKNKMPTQKLIQRIRKENKKMGTNNKKANNKMANNFDAMCQMQQQMMNNMFSMMGQKFPFFNQNGASGQTPEMKSMCEMMPNMNGMFSGMQNMMPSFQEVQDKMMDMAQLVMPLVYDQAAAALSNMVKMNKMAYEMTDQVISQQRQMNDKMFELAKKAVSTESAAEAEEAEAETAVAEETAAAESEAAEA